jgi:hypothetical protein
MTASTMSENCREPVRPDHTCHCEARSDEAISCLASRGTLVRQEIALMSLVNPLVCIFLSPGARLCRGRR